MKFAASAALIALFSFALGLYLPWWSIALSAFSVSALIYQRPIFAFAAGFAAVFVLWGLMAWARSSANDQILAHRASMLIFKTDSPGLLIFITALVGGITSGLASLSGSLFRRSANVA